MNLRISFRCYLAGMLLLIAGCTQSPEEAFLSSAENLRASESLEFLTINPQIVPGAEPVEAVKGFEILGRATLSRERFGVILDGLVAMVKSESSNARMCFSPGYGLRESKTGGAELLICLGCGRVEFTRDGEWCGAELGYTGAPELESYLAGLVQEFDLPTFEQP